MSQNYFDFLPNEIVELVTMLKIFFLFVTYAAENQQLFIP
jgi:hypothetical protein